MSEETHSSLVEAARRYLLRKCPLVITELGCYGEEADAIGWQQGVSTLIEAKATTSDFYADSTKSFRQISEHGVGNYRYYITPKGLIKSPEKLRASWGILEKSGNRISKVKDAEYLKDINYTQERRIMISAFRRLGQKSPEGVSCRAYYVHTGNRATVSIDIEEPTS